MLCYKIFKSFLVNKILWTDTPIQKEEKMLIHLMFFQVSNYRTNNIFTKASQGSGCSKWGQQTTLGPSVRSLVMLRGPTYQVRRRVGASCYLVLFMFFLIPNYFVFRMSRPSLSLFLFSSCFQFRWIYQEEKTVEAESWNSIFCLASKVKNIAKEDKK